MKKLIPLLAIGCIGLCCTGCLSTNFTEFAKAMQNDDASISVQVTTVYGTAKFVRIGPGTNATVTASPDGTITKKSP